MPREVTHDSLGLMLREVTHDTAAAAAAAAAAAKDRLLIKRLAIGFVHRTRLVHASAGAAEDRLVVVAAGEGLSGVGGKGGWAAGEALR